MRSTLKRMTVSSLDSLSAGEREYILENGPDDPKDMGVMGPFATTFSDCFECHVAPQVMRTWIVTLRERVERKRNGGGKSTRAQKPPKYKVNRRRGACGVTV